VVNLFPTPNYIGYNIYNRAVAEIGGAPIAATVVNVFVSENFVLGPMTTGSGWPAGAIINLYVQPGAKILGPGGNGGSGGSAFATVTKFRTVISGIVSRSFSINVKTTNSPTSGTAGGTALEVLHPINITNNGLIGGGGGGAGGSGAAAAGITFDPDYKNYATSLSAIGGNGGGGGAGFPAGKGGLAGTQEVYAYETTYDQFLVSTTVRYNEPTLFIGPVTLPIKGPDGSETKGGNKIHFAFQDGYKALTSTASFESYAKSPEGYYVEKGGDIGDAGQAGGNGYARWAITQLPNENYNGEANAENGATAGAAGAAIETNGNTVTYLITGDIRGAII
jgi:hypothetical protein